jgi:hypothetical protein
MILQEYYVNSEKALVSCTGSLLGTPVVAYYKTSDPITEGEAFCQAFRSWPGSTEPGLWYWNTTSFINYGPKPGPAYEFDFETLQWLDTRTLAEIAAEVVSQRNQLLQESDWTQLADIPQTTKDRWEPYRQALRDVTLQPGYPTTVTWPIKPQ